MSKAITLMTILVVLLVPGLCLAAGSSIACSQISVARSGFVQISCLATADDTDGSYPITKIPYSLGGKYLHQVKVFPGATGPTANSDLYLLQHTDTGKDLLNAAGENMVDNGTSDDTNFQPTINSAPSAVGIFGNVYIKITGNSVNDATVTIIFDFIYQ
jgi:hypothetical protein